MAFVKGISGNPKGQPKLSGERLEVKIAAQAMSLQALRVLKSIMSDKKADKKARVSAANAILDRACGKPKQPVDMGVHGNIHHTSGSAAAEVLRRLGGAGSIN